MKVYLYFLIDKKILEEFKGMYLLESINSINETSNGYFLYGYTNKKKVANKFEKIHDMNKFYKKIEEMDDDEYLKFEDMFSSFQKIDFRSFLCGPKTHAVLPATSGESWYSIEFPRESMNQYLEQKQFVNPIIFSDKVQYLLGEIGYFELFPDVLPYREYTSATAEYFNTNRWENRFGVYLKLYSSILNLEKIMEEVEYE